MKKMLPKIIICVVVMLGLLGAAGFGYLYNNGLSGQYANTTPVEGQIKVACVGDSITYGHGIEGWKENNYPAVLQELLGEDYHVANFGSSGSCVNPEGDQPYIDRAVYQDSLSYDADILVFMIGTNDSKPENWTGADAFAEDYKELLYSYLEGEDAPKVYIGLCAEAYFVGETDGTLAEYDIQPAIVDEITEIVHSYASQADIEVIDVHALTEAHPEWFEADGIHPNNDGAKAIAEAVAQAILEKE